MGLAWVWGLSGAGGRSLLARTGLADPGLGGLPTVWGLAGGWVGEKGSPRPTLPGSPSWHFCCGDTTFSGALPRVGGRGHDGWAFSFSGG